MVSSLSAADRSAFKIAVDDRKSHGAPYKDTCASLALFCRNQPGHKGNHCLRGTAPESEGVLLPGRIVEKSGALRTLCAFITGGTLTGAEIDTFVEACRGPAGLEEMTREHLTAIAQGKEPRAF